MKRVNKLLNCEKFKNTLEKIENIEKTRIYCGHNFEHLLDVARISYMLNLEENLKIDKEIIYVTAFLHDIGRFEEYTSNIPHDVASAEFAKEVLAYCDFNKDEEKTIIDAILSHRKNDSDTPLGKILYRADKLSRNCFSCSAENTCYWSKEKKNLQIKY